MHKWEFPTRRRMSNPRDHANQEWIERTPVEIYKAVPIISQEPIAHVEISDRIGFEVLLPRPGFDYSER